MNIRTFFGALLISALVLPTFAFAYVSTEDLSLSEGVDISFDLPLYYETSGAVYNPDNERLYVVSDPTNSGYSYVSHMELDGSDVVSWEFHDDLEGVTYDEDEEILYVLVENPDGIFSLDPETGELLDSWDLTPWIKTAGNSGAEAITFLNGLFYVGVQETGNILVVKLQAAGKVEYVDLLDPRHPTGEDLYTDLAGLQAYCGVLVALYDSSNRIAELNPADGELIRKYAAPGNAQEGIALIPNGDKTTMFISQDSGELIRYEGYPLNCEVEEEEEVVEEGPDYSVIDSFEKLRSPNVVRVHYESGDIQDIENPRARTWVKKSKDATRLVIVNFTTRTLVVYEEGEPIFTFEF
ncbi:hypothetical protein HOD30_02185 [Candidatus Peregrinibacteria bacterium]|jgi:hypothetical protein|nr:hypothetical protein [Candidatus Peregrinibacteria bacterium]MBT4631579.1 hypothetical protein [Candidatus Peregrinibacteria bacterium]MBT5517201.1 hypothetical protein [Candidatus Peregrinibacteria bacterium]MBT5824124.1 hypothetical protein [Candidatus Peregrinibacteria bacterium]